MSRSSRGGRHRLGPSHLRHCREIPEVEARFLGVGGVGRTRHASEAGTWSVRPSLLIGAGVVAALTSGWFTAGEALAQQLTHR